MATRNYGPMGEDYYEDGEGDLDTDDSSLTGTLAAALGTGAALSPVGRRAAGRLWAKTSPYTDPLTVMGLAASNTVGPMARKAASAMTGGASEVGRRAYGKTMAPGIAQDEYMAMAGGNNLMKDLQYTAAQAKAMGKGAWETAKAIPSATSKAFKKAEVRTAKWNSFKEEALPEAKKAPWIKFKNSDIGKSMGEDLELVGDLYAKNEKMTPMEAALYYFQYLAKANLNKAVKP